MAETQPFWMQALCYTYNELRTMGNNVCGEGVVDKRSGSLLVASSGAADHSVTVAAGYGWVEADGANVEGMYKIRNDASVTVQLAAGSGGDPRVDTIVATVRDTQSSGVDDDWILTVVAGTATASAALTDAGITASAGAVPDNTIVLAYVLVGGADTLTTTISGANILDARNNYEQCGAFPWVSLEATGTTSITDGQYVQIALASLVHRDRDYFTVSAGATPTVTVLEAGLYDLNAQGFYSNGAATTVGSAVLRNNTNLPHAAPNGLFVAENNVGGVRGFLPASGLQIELGANDTLKFAMTASGVTAATTHTAGSRVARFTVRKVG